MFDSWARPDYRETLVSLGLSPAAAASVAITWPDPASLSAATVGQLRRHGLTRGQARQLHAAVDLARLANRRPSGPLVTLPEHVFGIVGPALAVAEHEILVVVMLDAHQQVIDVATISQSCTRAVAVAPADVFRLAVRAAATSIVLAHNHPSGDPEPSPADLDLTDRMRDAGRLLGIHVLDHLVIARGGGFYSFADMGHF